MFFIMFLSDKLDFLNKLSNLDKETAEMIKEKVSQNKKSGLEKDQIFLTRMLLLIKKFKKRFLLN